MIRVLVVDDSALMRKKITQMLESDKEIKVIATARDGEDAVLKARDLNPDVMTLDVNMPTMDGITALQYIISENICPVIMLSSLTQEGALITYEALELGAFDFVAKPGGTISLKLEEIQKELITKVKFSVRSGTLSKLKNYRERKKAFKESEQKQKNAPLINNEPVTKAVAIGVSTGGPRVLTEIMQQLPANLGATIFIVQHIPANFTGSFAERLNTAANLRIKEAEAGEIVKQNAGYLGKGGFHLLLRQLYNAPVRIRLSPRPPMLFVPSVDLMMESVCEIFKNKTVGVLLTGMGDDGAESMLKIHKAGGITIAESEETAIVFGMPAEAIKRGAVDKVVPSYKVANEIVKAVNSL